MFYNRSYVNDYKENPIARKRDPDRRQNGRQTF